MSRLIVINLGSGNLLNGCSEVTAQISLPTDERHPRQCRGSLPPAPEIDRLYRNWQLLYQEFYRKPGLDSTRTLKIESGGVTNFSDAEFHSLTQQLKIRLNAWLDSESFRPIERKLSRVLDPTDEIRVIFETNDNLLLRLPWHLWNFFEDYPKAEIALSVLEYGQVKPQSTTPKGKVRILTVLGSSDGIDLQAERSAIAALPGADPLFLESPQRRELDEHLWDKKGWDILFFAGHSQTEGETGNGRIYINQTDSLTLAQLSNALKKAISRGLKLAIFNSCDGLGLAQNLADLHIGQVIVMRELVPDAIAQEFFKHFLEAFSGGQPLYTSVREARERLEKLEDEYPCATWLPVICQNPAVEPALWHQWCGVPLEQRSCLPNKSRLLNVLLASMAVTALVMGVRQLGVLQTWELQTFDQLMRLRPEEAPEPRILLVTITEADFQIPEQASRKGSLSDLALARLLEKLAPLKPRVIGLDIYRDSEVDPNQPNLATRLRSDESFFPICRVSEADEGGVLPPRIVPPQRLGFSDVVVDPDGILRRHLLAMQPNPSSPCTASYALSTQLALYYLEKENISAKYTQQGDLQVGNVVFKRLPDPIGGNLINGILNYLQARRGGYQRVDAWGYQILLNYRSYRSPSQIVPTVTLTDVLKGRINPEIVKDRIVLIGVTASSAGDFLSTPYSNGSQFHEQLPGVIVQAQMVSQILSVVKDGRPLLSVWPLWGEVLWIWGWAIGGGLIVWGCGRRRYLVLGGGVALGVLYLFCFSLLILGLWVPLVPSALASVATGGIVVYLAFRVKRQNYDQR